MKPDDHTLIYELSDDALETVVSIEQFELSSMRPTVLHVRAGKAKKNRHSAQ